MRYRIACLMMSFAVLAPAAAAADGSGAIAYSPATGSRGWSYSCASREGAEAAALKMCVAYARDCLVAVSYTGGCGALATAPSGAYSAVSGATRRAAEDEALSACGKASSSQCSVAVWSCSSG